MIKGMLEARKIALRIRKGERRALWLWLYDHTRAAGRDIWADDPQWASFEAIEYAVINLGGDPEELRRQGRENVVNRLLNK